MLKGFIIAGAAVIVAAAAGAAVVESTPTGFAIEEKIHIAETPDRVYAMLIEPATWWNPQHTISGNAANLSLEARAGGCLCEKLPQGGSVQHLTVIYAAPGATLRLKGAMGPFQSQGVDGVLTFSLAPKDGGTDLVLQNNVGGFMKNGFGDWPHGADMMFTDMVGRIKAHAEAGKGSASK
jgi:hypothetical protein